MKIVCDACAAKYSIADEKVRGKVFKIRCKKCSNIIVVRGAVSETAEPAPPRYDQKETKVLPYQGFDQTRRSESGAELTESAVWHLVIDQEQVGPLTVEEVLQRFQRGEIDGDGYVWREGFGDWERLADVDEFAGLTSGARAQQGALGALFGSAGHDQSEQYDEARGAQNDPADLFAARGAGEDSGLVAADLFGSGPAMAAASPELGGGDADALFGSGLSDAEVGGLGMDATVRNGGSSARQASSSLTGQRNENSVLFSLNNLAALASDAPRSAPLSASSSSSMSSASVSAAGTPPPTEGSGLIDIRSMAQVYLGDSKSSTRTVGSAEDLPVFSQAPFESASPVLLPSVQSAVSNRLLIALFGLIGVLVIAAVLLVVIVLKAGNDRPRLAASDTGEPRDRQGAETSPGTVSEPPAPLASAAPTAMPTAGSIAPVPTSDGPSGGQAGGGDSTGSTPPASGHSASVAGASDEPATAAKEPSRSSDRDRGKDRDRDKDREQARDRDRDRDQDRDRDRDRRSARHLESGSSRDKPAEPPPTDPTATSGCDEVTCLVEPDKPCCRKYMRRSGSRSSDSSSQADDPSLPERPSRGDVASGIGDVKGTVSACSSRAPGGGKVTVKIKISPAGSVSSASATGGSSNLNACVENAVKRARFPKSQLGASVNYPFIF